MASSQTANYSLNQWEAGDQVLRAEFNEDNQRVDGALAGLAGEMTGKANQSEVDSLSAALTAGLAQKGNCQLVSGSYVGTGEYGLLKDNTLTFERRPLFLILVKDLIMMISGLADRGQATPVLGNAMAASTFDWVGNQVMWSSNDSS